MSTYKVIVAGGRDFTDFVKLTVVLDKLLKNKEDVTIVSGCARGADALGERYAKLRGLQVLLVPAVWDKYGKSAGYKRNAEMANVADALVAFWDGKSKGTKHMIDLGKVNLEVRVINY